MTRKRGELELPHSFRCITSQNPRANRFKLLNDEHHGALAARISRIQVDYVMAGQLVIQLHYHRNSYYCNFPQNPLKTSITRLIAFVVLCCISQHTKFIDPTKVYLCKHYSYDCLCEQTVHRKFREFRWKFEA